MASGVTYQALKRLSWLPDREALDNGSIIGGQEYDDIYFIGGAITGVALTDVTINGISTTPTLRLITAGNVTGLATDFIIVIKKVSGSATSVTLPSVPSTNQFFWVKDGKGDANTNNITINGNGNTIDGGSSYVIGSAYGWINLVWNGDEWSIVG